MKVTVSTDEFRRSHGKGPRGYGYWWFNFVLAYGNIERGFHGTYGDAKKQAILVAKMHDTTIVRVMS